MNPNGSRQINLTHHPEPDYMPAFSPTGTQILFVSGRDGVPDLYLMDTDGTNVQRVFVEAAHRSDPTWSPDGKWIAYQKGAWHDNRELYIANRDGQGVARIVAPTWDPAVSEVNPVWSPDGSELIYEHIVEKAPREGRIVQDTQLYKTDLNGGDPKQLTQHGTNEDADWFDPAFALSVKPQPQLLTTMWAKLKQK